MSLPALKDLFARHRTGATGLWRLGQEPNRIVYFEAGNVVFAASSHPQDRLTHLLVERGKLTQVQLDYAMANLNPTMSIGRNLIEMGFITQRDLLDVARAQVERVVWAVMAETLERPAFEAKALDASTVRLPFDTPAMLLAGVLNLQDREPLLAELGPLDQMVALEVPRLPELNLPPDLVRLPGLLGGQRTLLDLSREAGVEPFRLGAFALYLREMGWARLQMAPSSPEAPRAPESEPILIAPVPPPAALPVPPPSPAIPSLIQAIEASQVPTTNLEHLSEALDQLGPEDKWEEAGQGGLQPPLSQERSLPIHQTAAGSTEPPDFESLETRKTSRRPLYLFGILLLVAGLWGGLRWYQRNPIILPKLAKPSPLNPPAPAPKPEQPISEAAPGVEVKSEPKPEAQPAPNSDAKPVSEPARAAQVIPPAQPKAAPKPSVSSQTDRLKAIQAGNWKLAHSQGLALCAASHGKWSLRLEIACQGDTIQRAASLLRSQNPDLFLLPMTMRNGRTCHQIFLGTYESESAALAAARRLPPPFLAEGNRPKPFRVDQIPSRQ
ncbi:DUF4388 domain-containing protein [Geothrix alkalitolerans]|uniref:DUF4388 domain-containing protein n=1 Tax=Geothrix alkalitolerans TaxID=2922724 RepID=UPI001FB020A0|nr:DUF4388 domain-containing protein [Geothrix alkalitolerans]